MIILKPGDRVRYTYKNCNEYLPPFEGEGTVQDDVIGYTCATFVLFDDWRDPLAVGIATGGAFLCDNDDLELIV